MQETQSEESKQGKDEDEEECVLSLTSPLHLRDSDRLLIDPVHSISVSPPQEAQNCCSLDLFYAYPQDLSAYAMLTAYKRFKIQHKSLKDQS